jgi:UDP-N-acetylmuramyl pentapeptide phosphotransferase/UDP-N-acetylglucosamine-1-phosphate transferase
MNVVVSLMIAAAAAAVSAALVKLLMPLLQRYALARPNARSSHTVPTPQGAGLAVMLAVLLVAAVVLASTPNTTQHPQWSFIALGCALAALAAVGMADDILQLGVRLRLAVQVMASSLLLAGLPHNFEVLPWLIPQLTSVLLVVGLVWFINLTNFMDGIDGMTVAGLVPVLIGGVLLLQLDQVRSGRPLAGIDVPALALLGALLGFAPFNRHVAKVFLGDVGSLPIGGLVGWLLLVLAGRGHWAAAVILPLYYLADATITLGRRFQRGENLATAHRTHFYQLATQRGYSTPEVTARVWMLNAVLIVLALATVWKPHLAVKLLALAAAGVVTGSILLQFDRGKMQQAAP